MNTDNIVIGEEFSNGMLELEKFDHDYIADISDYLLSIPETFLLLSKPEIKFIGVGHSKLQLQQIPVDEHDEKLDAVIY